jgi:hypothetical protein
MEQGVSSQLLTEEKCTMKTHRAGGAILRHPSGDPKAMDQMEDALTGKLM